MAEIKCTLCKKTDCDCDDQYENYKEGNID